MIFARFAVTCRPERTEEMARLLVAVEGPSRAIPGVLHYDSTRSLTDPNGFVVLEVFEDRRAFDRQNEQAEVAAVLRLVPEGTLTGDFEWAMWES